MRQNQLRGFWPYLLQEVLQAALLFFALKKIGVARAFKYGFLILLGAGVAVMVGIIVTLFLKIGKTVLKALFFAVFNMAKGLAHFILFLLHK